MFGSLVMHPTDRKLLPYAIGALALFVAFGMVFGSDTAKEEDERAYRIGFESCKKSGDTDVNCARIARMFVQQQGNRAERPTDTQVIANEAAKIDAYCETTQDC